MSRAREIASRFGKVRVSGAGYMCKCPCHEDSTASLWIADNTNGSVYVECKAGCDYQTLRKVLGIDNEKQTAPAAHQVTYDYTDISGKLVFQKVRKPNKAFSIRRPDDAGGWAFNLEGVKEKPLFNLPSVVAAIKTGELVAVLEGEKDCRNFQKFSGVVSTTNFDGAGKWRAEYVEALRGANVVVLYDNDAPGIAHKNTIISALKFVADSLTVVHLPSTFNGRPVKDFSDYLAAGATLEDFQKLTPEIIKAETIKLEAQKASDWLREPEAPLEPLLAGVFDRGDKVVLIGQSKTRKSFFAQQLAFCLASARSFLNFPALDACRVLIVQSEIKKNRYHMRCKRMAERLAIEPGELESLMIFNARGVLNLQEELEAQAIKHKPDVIIIDPFYKLIAGDENKSEEVKPILKFFDSLAERTGAAVLYVHHDKKGVSGDMQLTDRGSGSGVVARDFDSAIFLAPHESVEDGLVVEFVTRNYASPNGIAVEWQNYGFHTSNIEVKKKTSRSMLKTKKASVSELLEKTTKMLKTEWVQGNKAIKMAVFNLKLEEAGVPPKALTAIKEELVTAGLIFIETRKAGRGESPKVVTLSELVGVTRGEIREEVELEPLF